VPAGLNRVMLLGDLSSDPEVYVTRSGQVVLTLRLGTPESYLDRDDVKRERVSYHHVVVVGRRADALSKVLRRGARVFVEGSLRTTPYDARDGKQRTKTEVVASEVLFAGEAAPSPGPFEGARPSLPVNESLPFR
jgi:single-strand DNA-binding protein